MESFLRLVRAKCMAVIALWTIAMLGSTAQGGGITGIVSFGDSLSDVGNRQGFSHRDADAKSLLDEALRREMGEHGRANGGRWARSEGSISVGPRK
jgi:phospholipase/lecithinase/hemolysin